MTKKRTHPIAAVAPAVLPQNLRQRAEAKLRADKPQPTVRLSPEDTQQVLHELQVHQIELELQNEELRQTQAELEASRARYFDLYNLAPAGYVTLSERGLILEANLAAAGLLGVARGALVGQLLTRFIAPADQDIYYRHRQHLFETGAPQAYELRLARPGGSPLWARLEMTTMAAAGAQGADGAPVCLAAVSDITALKQAEEAQLKAYQQTHAILESISDAFFSLDLQLRVTYFNAAAEQALGRERGDVLGRPLFEAFPEARGSAFDEHYTRALREQVTLHFETYFGIPPYANWYEVRVYPYAGGLSVYFQVITERKQAEEALRASEAQYRLSESELRAAQAVARIGNWKWNIPKGEITWSDEMYRIFGIDKTAYTGRLGDVIAQVIHPDDLHLVLPANARGFVEDKPIEYRIILPDKSIRHIWARAGETVLDTDGHPIFLTGIAQDITERRRVEEALRQLNAELEQRVDERSAELRAANTELTETNQHLVRALRTKDEFLAAMSHELRTPLTAILALAELLQMQTYGALTEKQAYYAQTIYQSGQHLLELINDVLDLAKLAAGQTPVELGPVTVAEVCQAALQLIKPQADKKQIAVSLALDPAATHLQADQRRLKQILVNLLSNAVKFTPADGQVGLVVSGDEKERRVEFTVWDTGIGIAAEDLLRLFRDFVQLDARLARNYEGTGLGLALVRRLAELQGGHVRAESQGPGKGSQFTVSLPWEPVSPAPKVLAEPEKPPATP